MTERQAFEAWVDRTWPLGLNEYEFVVAWDAWQEAAKQERERQHTQPSSSEQGKTNGPT